MNWKLRKEGEIRLEQGKPVNSDKMQIINLALISQSPAGYFVLSPYLLFLATPYPPRLITRPSTEMSSSSRANPPLDGTATPDAWPDRGRRGHCTARAARRLLVARCATQNLRSGCVSRSPDCSHQTVWAGCHAPTGNVPDPALPAPAGPSQATAAALHASGRKGRIVASCAPCDASELVCH